MNWDNDFYNPDDAGDDWPVEDDENEYSNWYYDPDEPW